jgi:hypothetical protein
MAETVATGRPRTSSAGWLEELASEIRWREPECLYPEGWEPRRFANMVIVTERAKERLRELLETKTEDASVSLRLELTPSGQFAVFPDQERRMIRSLSTKARPCSWSVRRSLSA